MKCAAAALFFLLIAVVTFLMFGAVTAASHPGRTARRLPLLPDQVHEVEPAGQRTPLSRWQQLRQLRHHYCGVGTCGMPGSEWHVLRSHCGTGMPMYAV